MFFIKRAYIQQTSPGSDGEAELERFLQEEIVFTKQRIFADESDIELTMKSTVLRLPGYCA